MTTIAAPPVHRNWQKHKPLNHNSNDHTLENGVRISTPLYIDLTINQRKELLNEVRELTSSLSNVRSTGSLQVVEMSSNASEVEGYIGMTVDVLRNVLFQRGGIALDLVLKLQEVTGIVFVTDKDVAAAHKVKLAVVKSFLTENPFDGN